MFGYGLPRGRPRPVPRRDRARRARQIGVLLTLTLLGDAAISLLADDARGPDRPAAGAARRGRPDARRGPRVRGSRRCSSCSWSPRRSGCISPSGNEVGPFLAVEQASLAQVTDPARGGRAIFARYQLVGAVATAAGALDRRPGRPGLPSRPSPCRSDAYRVVDRRLRPRRRRARGAVLRGLGAAVEVPAGRPTADDRHPAPARAAPVATASSSGCRPVRARRVRRRLRHRRASSPSGSTQRFGVDPVGARARSSRRQPARRGLGARRRPARAAVRAGQHDGVHAPAVERAADPRPADADAARSRPPCCSPGSRSARWTSRPASPTRWRSSSPTSARPLPA